MGERFLFYDELGNKIEFMVKAKFTLDDIDYAALLSAEDIDSDVYILRIEMDDMGDTVFASIDGEELDEAIKAYEELLKKNLQ